MVPSSVILTKGNNHFDKRDKKSTNVVSNQKGSNVNVRKVCEHAVDWVLVQSVAEVYGGSHSKSDPEEPSHSGSRRLQSNDKTQDDSQVDDVETDRSKHTVNQRAARRTASCRT